MVFCEVMSAGRPDPDDRRGVAGIGRAVAPAQVCGPEAVVVFQGTAGRECGGHRILADPDQPAGEVARAADAAVGAHVDGGMPERARSEEHTSELQSLMRIAYAVLCV